MEYLKHIFVKNHHDFPNRNVRISVIFWDIRVPNIYYVRLDIFGEKMQVLQCSISEADNSVGFSACTGPKWLKTGVCTGGCDEDR